MVCTQLSRISVRQNTFGADCIYETLTYRYDTVTFYIAMVEDANGRLRSLHRRRREARDRVLHGPAWIQARDAPGPALRGGLARRPAHLPDATVAVRRRRAHAFGRGAEARRLEPHPSVGRGSARRRRNADGGRQPLPQRRGPRRRRQADPAGGPLGQSGRAVSAKPGGISGAGLDKQSRASLRPGPARATGEPMAAARLKRMPDPRIQR